MTMGGFDYTTILNAIKTAVSNTYTTLSTYVNASLSSIKTSIDAVDTVLDTYLDSSLSGIKTSIDAVTTAIGGITISSKVLVDSKDYVAGSTGTQTITLQNSKSGSMFCFYAAPGNAADVVITIPVDATHSVTKTVKAGMVINDIFVYTAVATLSVSMTTGDVLTYEAYN